MFVSPVTHKQPAPDPLFLESKDHKKRPLNEIHSMFLAHLSVAVMGEKNEIRVTGENGV